MKSLSLKAVVCAIATCALVSCSGLDTDAPRLLSKSEAQRSYSPYSSQWAGAPFYPAEVDVATKAAAQSLPKDKHGAPTYLSDGVRHRVVRTTAYSCEENEVGAVGNLNAMGTVLKYGMVRSAAADWSRYPVGTTFRIKGLPYTYVVDDYGSALVGTNTIDIYHPNLASMKAWASRNVEISIIKWGSYERAANLLKGRTKYNHCARMYYAALRKLNGSRLSADTNRKRFGDL